MELCSVTFGDIPPPPLEITKDVYFGFSSFTQVYTWLVICWPLSTPHATFFYSWVSQC